MRGKRQGDQEGGRCKEKEGREAEGRKEEREGKDEREMGRGRTGLKENGIMSFEIRKKGVIEHPLYITYRLHMYV